MDGIGNTIEEARKNYKVIDRRCKLLTLRKVAVSRERSFLKNAILFLVQSAPRFLLSEKKICMDIERISSKADFDKSNYGGNLVGAWGFKEVMERSVFGNPTIYEFENIKIYGAQNAEQYLNNQYGDWRKLPSKEKQITHHDYYLNLSESFIQKGKERRD